MKNKILAIALIFMLLTSIGYCEEVIQSQVITPDESVQLVREKKVTIFIDRKPVLHEGETVRLTSKLDGFEGCNEIRYNWEVDKNDGHGFQAVPGATNDHYEFSATAETLSWSWRLCVWYD